MGHIHLHVAIPYVIYTEYVCSTYESFTKYMPTLRKYAKGRRLFNRTFFQSTVVITWENARAQKTNCAFASHVTSELCLHFTSVRTDVPRSARNNASRNPFFWLQVRQKNDNDSHVSDSGQVATTK